jgi:hypothetical protein
MAKLLVELQALDLQDDAETPNSHRIGLRVRITRKDGYLNREGEIISPHGTKFWNVRLDKGPSDKMQIIIFKSPKYLQIIPD